MRAPLRLFAVAMVAVAFQAVMVAANVWPASRTAPHDLPVVVAGPEPAASAIARRIEARYPEAFAVERLPDEQSARQALTGRHAYGAVIAGPKGPRLIVASGAGPVVTQSLAGLAQHLSGRPVTAPRDVAPPAAHDPRGAGGAALILALVLSGIFGAIVLSLFVKAVAWRVAGLVAFAAGAGLVSALIVDTGLSVLPGSYPAVAGAIALATLTVAASVAGLGAVVPRAGLGLGAAVMMLLANPWSGAASAPEMLPRPYGTIGQYLPAGAATSLLRSVTFFDGTGAGTPLAVLLIWTSYGLIFLFAGTRRHELVHRPTHAAVRPVDVDGLGQTRVHTEPPATLGYIR